MPSKLPVLAVLLLLASLLLAASAGQAAPTGPATASLVLEEEEFEIEEEAEFSENECGFAEEEFEEGLLSEVDVEELCEETATQGAKSAGAHRSACFLRSTNARAILNDKNHKLRLTIGYTTYEPANAKVEVRKGSTRIASFRRHLGRSGVLRVVKRLGRKGAPKRVVIRIRIPSSPSYCGKVQTKKVRVA